MSIIADTLQRLQTQAKGSVPPDSPSVVIPHSSKREPGWHTPPSRGKFWLTGVGIALGLSGLGLGAYWIGFNLDFGMSTYASPQPRQSIARSVPSPTLVTESFESPSSESVEMSVVNLVQDAPSSTSRQPGVEPSTIQDAVRSEISYPPNTEVPLLTPLLVAVPVSSETEVDSLASTPRQPHQATISTNVSIPDSVIDIPPQKESPKPKAASTGPPFKSVAQSEKSGSKLVVSEEFDVTENRIPVKAAWEESRIRMAEFSSSPHGSDDTPLLPNTTAMVPKIDEHHPTDQGPGPVQPSPSDRLRPAQQLIQAGKYDEAVSVLSPLFTDPPVNWEPWFWMGTALLGQGDLEQADQFFLSGLARNDKIPQLWIQRALVAHQQGDYELAIHELRRAESLDAALPHIHLNMGYVYEKLGNVRLANDYYAKFLKLSEGNPAFFSIRKKLYARFTEQVHSIPHPGHSSAVPGIPYHLP
jgi:hypothetical protein